MNRKYLRLTYAESSYMEYTEEWENRMKIWDEVMDDMERGNDTSTTEKSTITTPGSNTNCQIPSSNLIWFIFAVLILSVF